MSLLYMDFPSWIRPEVIPGLPVPRWYSMMYVIGFAIAWKVMTYKCRKDGFIDESQRVMEMIMYGIVGMIIGLRLFYVLFYSGDNTLYYLTRPWLIWWPFQNGRFTGFTGLSYHGGLFGITAGVIVYSLRRGDRVMFWGDMIALSAPLGYTFGRIGNFINGELYGRVTTVPWGVLFPQAEIQGDTFSGGLGWVQDIANKTGISLDSAMVNLPRHPSQLYEAVFEGVALWAALWFIMNPIKKRWVKFDGFLISCYLIGYGLSRFVIEYFRQPDEHVGFVIQTVPGNFRYQVHPLNLSMGQMLCLAMIAAGIIVMVVCRHLYKRREAANLAEPVQKPVEPDSPHKRNQRRHARKKLKK